VWLEPCPWLPAVEAVRLQTVLLRRQESSPAKPLQRCARLDPCLRRGTGVPPSPSCSAIARDGGWAGFLLAQLDRSKPILWVQDPMAILESGRDLSAGARQQWHPPRRGPRRADGAVGDGGGPKMLCPLRSRRRAVGRSGGARLHRDQAACGGFRTDARPCWLVRLGGTANLSGARMRWLIASASSVMRTRSIRERRELPPGTPSCFVPARRGPAGGESLVKRILSIWLPSLAVERWAKSADLPPDAPIVLTIEGTHGPVIHAVTKAAAGRGAQVRLLADRRPGARSGTDRPSRPIGKATKRFSGGWRDGRCAGRRSSRWTGPLGFARDRFAAARRQLE
jgi:hypothetical protein